MRELSDQLNEISTPAIILDEGIVSARCFDLAHICENCGCRPLFAVKALSNPDVLELMAPPLSGYSVSSLFEARIVRETVGQATLVHFTSPGLRSPEIEELTAYCDYVSFNSISQLDRFGEQMALAAQCGLRVNPQYSCVADPRFDPCRPHSKLGVPIYELAILLANRRDLAKRISGILVHNNCESTNFADLLKTVKRLVATVARLPIEIEWVNLGGGYLFSGRKAPRELAEAVGLLRERFPGSQVFVEPGASLTRDAGYLVTTVLDQFDSQGKSVVVLDTSINHMPEVFEYCYEPSVDGHSESGRFTYQLSGTTCLAGDIFGEYSFDEPLKIGSRLVFTEMGAYTTVKAHMFNGVNLPSVYARRPDGTLQLRRTYDYKDFASRWPKRTAQNDGTWERATIQANVKESTDATV